VPLGELQTREAGGLRLASVGREEKEGVHKKEKSRRTQKLNGPSKGGTARHRRAWARIYAGMDSGRACRRRRERGISEKKKLIRDLRPYEGNLTKGLSVRENEPPSGAFNSLALAICVGLGGRVEKKTAGAQS